MSTEPLLRTLVGRALRRVRAAEHRTLQDVATEARISIAYLSEVERGRKEASSEVLLAICRALRIRLVDLLAEATGELLAADLTIDLAQRRRRLDLTGPAGPAGPMTGSPRAARTGDGPTVRLSVA